MGERRARRASSKRTDRGHRHGSSRAPCLTGVAAAEDPWPAEYARQGGVLQPLGPQSLTPAKQRLRTQARRAIGLGAPDLTSARANLGRANRAADRAARATRSATLLRARAERLAPSAAAAARTSAERQDVIAATALEQQSERLDAMADDLSLATAATCAIPPQPSPYSIFTLPAWSDLAGWDARDQYGTIQLADVTGDGADEVLGRGTDGVELSQMSNATGVFSALPDGPPLSDAAGWDKDRFALTIRSGDISGDGQAEIIGLDGDGKIVTFLRDATTGAWTELPATSSPAWDDKGTDWSESTHYETLQLVDLDGDRVDELVARASRGIIAARFDAAANAWTPAEPRPGALRRGGLEQGALLLDDPLRRRRRSAGRRARRPRRRPRLARLELRPDHRHVEQPRKRFASRMAERHDRLGQASVLRDGAAGGPGRRPARCPGAARAIRERAGGGALGPRHLLVGRDADEPGALGRRRLGPAPVLRVASRR